MSVQTTKNIYCSSQFCNSGITLGQRLVDGGILTADRLQHAKEMSEEHGWPVARILLAFGFVARATFSHFIIDFTQVEPLVLAGDESLTDLDIGVPPYLFEDYQFFPLYQDDQYIDIAVLDPCDNRPAEAIKEYTGKEARYRFVLDLDLSWAINKTFGKETVRDSVYMLFLEDPARSSIQPFTGRQIIFLFGLVSLTLLGFYYDAILAGSIFMLALNIFGAISIAFKLLLTAVGAREELHEAITAEDVAAIDDDTLPVYSILVPVYKEAEIVRQIAYGLSRLDYPLTKIDVKLLLEEDDLETLEALRDLDVPALMDVIVIPDMFPKTKPKACNYGLMYCKGKYVTIFDAEDIPEKDQLKKAVAAFRKFPENVAVVQAALNYFNATENWLTRMFTLEYSYWFDYNLPGLDKLKMPIPLGGTSNHFKMDVLNELCAWDPYNVTEDADLGVRATALGYKVGIINSTTYEEANVAAGNWIRQRSRWIKGYMQTVLIHIRNPIHLWREIGTYAMFGFLLFIGGTPISFLAHLPSWLMFLGWLIFDWQWVGELFPGWALYLALTNLLVGNSMMIYVNMIAVFRRKNYKLTAYALWNPFYWCLHSIASYKALWQLFFKPSYWEKTTHGLSKFVPSEEELDV